MAPIVTPLWIWRNIESLFVSGVSKYVFSLLAQCGLFSLLTKYELFLVSKDVCWSSMGFGGEEVLYMHQKYDFYFTSLPLRSCCYSSFCSFRSAARWASAVYLKQLTDVLGHFLAERARFLSVSSEPPQPSSLLLCCSQLSGRPRAVRGESSRWRQQHLPHSLQIMLCRLFTDLAMLSCCLWRLVWNDSPVPSQLASLRWMKEHASEMVDPISAADCGPGPERRQPLI